MKIKSVGSDTKTLVISDLGPFSLNLMRCLNGCVQEIHLWGGWRHGGVRWSRYCRRFTSFKQVDFWKDPEEFAKKIIKYFRKHKLDIIIPADLEGALIVAKIRNFLPDDIRLFPVAELDQLNLLNDKWQFAELAKKYSFPHPASRLIGKLEDAATLDLTFPIIVKPLNLGYGLGIKKMESLDEIKKHITGSSDFNQLPLLAQEYIPGQDISLSLLADSGRIVAWTIQKHITESRIEFIQDEDVLNLGERIVSMIGYHGVANFDMRLDSRNRKIYVLECNPRFWGSMRASMWNGVNFPELGIRLGLGKSLPKQSDCKNTNYVYPSRILENLARGNFLILKDMPKASLSDLAQLVADPIPALYQSFGHFFRKKHTRLLGVS